MQPLAGAGVHSKRCSESWGMPLSLLHLQVLGGRVTKQSGHQCHSAQRGQTDNTSADLRVFLCCTAQGREAKDTGSQKHTSTAFQSGRKQSVPTSPLPPSLGPLWRQDGQNWEAAFLPWVKRPDIRRGGRRRGGKMTQFYFN